MSNYKVKVNNEAELREVQGLFEQFGGKHHGADFGRVGLVVLVNNIIYIDFVAHEMYYTNKYKCEEITIQQLRDLVVLKRNSIDDATHEGNHGSLWYLGDVKYGWRFDLEKWELDDPKNTAIKWGELKPIKKKEIKEYLVPQDNGKYALTKATEKRVSDWVEVPDGMNFAHKDEFNIHFTKLEMGYRDSIIVWQRHTQPEELPFVDDESKSLNDTYAEIEQVRQDNVNNPSHYSDSSIECIDAMEAMMTPEQFIGYLRGNVFKYQWRYEKKNGIEDLKKAQWYLDKLVAKVNEK